MGSIGAVSADEIMNCETSPSPSSPVLKEDVMCVALGKDEEEGETVLTWALKNLNGMKRVCVLHVHQPSQRIPTMMGGKFPIKLVGKEEVDAYNEHERNTMHLILDKYTRICNRVAKVQAEKLWTEADSVEKGLVKLISENCVKWLVMGAAANKFYSKKMTEPMSKKAIFVSKEAPSFCHISFICKGNLICSSSRQRPDVPLLPTKGVVRDKSPQNEERSSGCENLSMTSPSIASPLSNSSLSELFEDVITISPLVRTDKYERFWLDPSPKHTDRLEISADEAESSRKEAYVELAKQRKAEKDAIDAIHKAKASEAMCVEDLKHRREAEEALERGKEKAGILKWKVDELMEELRMAEEEKISLEQRIIDSDKAAQELEQKMYSAIELLHKYKDQRDDLQTNCDNAFRELEQVRKRRAMEASSSAVSQFFREFSFSEIQEATNNFSQASKIGEKGHCFIYRGNIRHTEVAIKMPKPNSSQGHLEFQQEVNTMSTLRHPNIITLIGACPESYALVYEHLPNGSLEDRLNCKNNAPPLSWKDRIRIATEICSALIFLHRCKLLHGDLKPSNVLLDSNLKSKLGDFATYSTNLNAKSDVYGFGIVLLRMLTGRSAAAGEVTEGLDRGTVMDLLDPTAGDWPFVQARQLAHLAVRCCGEEPSLGADLGSEAWRILEPMNVFCGSSLSVGPGRRVRVPPCFVCPILQEVMQEPVVAADGFTYEEEAIKGWFESGQEASPMTNVKLTHYNLVTNHALRSAIRERIQ